jgi:hypothetical protein
MNIKYLLFASALMLSSFMMVFGQNGGRLIVNPLPLKASKSQIINNSINQVKAPGDTLWYEDFGNGFTTNGWVSTDISNNGLNWIYTTNAPGGQYSASIPALVSATSANGFASLPSDFYNTPTPTAGFFQMASFLQSGPISISPKASLEVRWTQSQRYCCASTEQLELQVSVDGISWVSFDAKFGRQANIAVVENAQMDISSVAANQSTIYLRFYQTSSHYYWMIDDIAIIETGNGQLEVSETFLLDQANTPTYYSIYPCFNPPFFTPAGVINNPTNSSGTNVRLTSAIVNGGNAGYLGSSPVNPLIPPFQSSTFQMSSLYTGSSIVDDYSILYKGIADSAVAVPVNSTISFSISDSTFARDLNNPTNSIGPNSYVGGSSLNSHLGVFYELKNAGIISSISFYVANDTNNVGMTISAELFSIDTAIFNVGASVAGSQNYTIDQSDLGSWVSLAIGQPNQTIVPGLYSAAIVQRGRTIPTNTLQLGRDVTAETLAPFGTSAVSSVFVNTTATFGLINSLPMIRLNFKPNGNCTTVGIENLVEVSEQINVFPNPSKGLVNIQLPADHKIEQIEVYAVNGKKVLSTAVTDQSNRLEINLADNKKGVYFLRLIAQDGVITKKVVID